MKNEPKVILYQAKSGAIELKGDLKKETIWATQKQLAEMFSVDVRTVNEHIQNIFKTKELLKQQTIRNFRIVQVEGRKKVSRNIAHYNLDMIISVGYRVNSKTVTQVPPMGNKNSSAERLTQHTKYAKIAIYEKCTNK